MNPLDSRSPAEWAAEDCYEKLDAAVREADALREALREIRRVATDDVLPGIPLSNRIRDLADAALRAALSHSGDAPVDAIS